MNFFTRLISKPSLEDLDAKIKENQQHIADLHEHHDNAAKIVKEATNDLFAGVGMMGFSAGITGTVGSGIVAAVNYIATSNNTPETMAALERNYPTGIAIGATFAIGAAIMMQPALDSVKKLTLGMIDAHLDQPLGLKSAEKSLLKAEAKRDRIYPPSPADLAKRLDARAATVAPTVSPDHPIHRKAHRKTLSV